MTRACRRRFSPTSPLLVVLPVLVLMPACKRVIEPGPEVVESFEVSLNFDEATLLAAGCDSTLPDTCYRNAGTVEAPLPFTATGYLSFFFDITAVGSEGTKPFPFSGEIGVSLPRGSISVSQPAIVLDGGVATAVQVRMRRVPGATTVFFEDRLEGRNPSPPTFAVGASPKIIFAYPTIPQIQETDDEGSSPVYKNYVEITEGTLLVTRIAASGLNVQDLDTTQWNGMYVYAYNGVEGILPGSQLFFLGGTVTEFLGSTQIQSPIYAAPHIRCEVELNAVEDVEDTEVDEGGLAVVARCPKGTTCTQVTEPRDDGKTARLHRCVPDTNPERWDKYGRILCTGPGDTTCPAGATCEQDLDRDEGTYVCQVKPVTPPSGSWPKYFADSPYCGPIHTDNTSPLVSEMYEGKLVKIDDSHGPIRVEGLPLCRHVDDLQSVRSSCNVTDAVPDCSIAKAGDKILRDPQGTVCYRWNQACANEGTAWTKLRSSCNPDPSLPYCNEAAAGQPLLKNNACKKVGDQTWQAVRSTCNPDPAKSPCTLAATGDPVLTDDSGSACTRLDDDYPATICRSTMDDFIMGGYNEFNQWKVVWPISDSGDEVCATVIADALASFNPFDLQESPGTLKSITGTLKQTRFQSGSSFWMIEVRGPEDLVD